MLNPPRTLWATKPLSDDNSGVRQVFVAKVSLLLTQSTPVMSYNTTRLCWFSAT